MASLVRLKESKQSFFEKKDQKTFVSLRIDKVSKSFDNRIVLDDISLTIHSGQFVAIVGRSGSGKSTLLRLFAGLEQPDSGTITPPPPSTRIMFQDGRLLPWRRVLQNVTLGLPAAEHPRARAALQSVGLSDRAHDWPRVLSGGQRQRVALARALAANPSLILLDEPLGALDALTRLEMQDLIEQIWQGRGFTAILVTHDVAEAARLADRILLIDAGRIALDMPVHLPRPRQPSAALADIEQSVLARILQR